jgi:hypothetical protein
VKRIIDTFLTRNKSRGKFSNFYFRHFAGTGKTVLLKLFGEELQQRGFVVFMLTPPELEDFQSGYFEKVVAMSERQTGGCVSGCSTKECEIEALGLLAREDSKKSACSGHWNL